MNYTGKNIYSNLKDPILISNNKIPLYGTNKPLHLLPDLLVSMYQYTKICKKKMNKVNFYKSYSHFFSSTIQIQIRILPIVLP